MRSQKQQTHLHDGEPNELEKLQEFFQAIFGDGARFRFEIESYVHSGTRLTLTADAPLSEVLGRMHYFEAAVCALLERTKGASAAEVIRRHQAAEIVEMGSAFEIDEGGSER